MNLQTSIKESPKSIDGKSPSLRRSFNSQEELIGEGDDITDRDYKSEKIQINRGDYEIGEYDSEDGEAWKPSKRENQRTERHEQRFRAEDLSSSEVQTSTSSTLGVSNLGVV